MPGDMMMVSYLGSPHAAEKLLCPIGAGTIEAVSFLMVDPLQPSPGMTQ